MIPTQLLRTSRLSILREDLARKKADLQRTYNFTLESIKLKIFRNVSVRIISVEHPYINFENTGDYRGYIHSATKPAEMTITFLEDEKHIVNGAFNAWDILKYDKENGIHYPKAVYEDIGLLFYFGSMHSKLDIPITRTYLLLGFYPVNRETVSLSFSDNDVLKLTVPFNVDEIKPLHIMGAGV